MARPGRLPLVVAALAVAIFASCAFVLPSQGPAAPPLKSSRVSSGIVPDADDNIVSEMLTASVEPETAFGQATRWIACGLAAGLLAAALSAPAEARQGWLAGNYIDQESLNPIASGKLGLCKDNKKYKKNLKNELYSFDQRKKKYPAGSVVWNRIEASKKLAERRAEAYGTRWCGKDGRPRVVATLSNLRGGVLIPALMFLYTAGWIGWAGRSYLMKTRSAEKEINIDVPLAFTCMASGFAWPVLAWQDIVNGEMTVSDNDIYKGLF
jgi:photosystem I subunit 3